MYAMHECYLLTGMTKQHLSALTLIYAFMRAPHRDFRDVTDRIRDRHIRRRMPPPNVYDACVSALFSGRASARCVIYVAHIFRRSTQPCIPPGSLNRVPASAGVKAGMSPLPGGR